MQAKLKGVTHDFLFETITNHLPIIQNAFNMFSKKKKKTANLLDDPF